MTDIKQHLPLILTALRRHVAARETPEALLTRLRELLPASYGLGAGSLVSASGERSQPLDLLIYDTTIASTSTSEQAALYDVRQVLVMIMLAHQPDGAALRDLLRVIASAKALRSGESRQQPRQQRGKKDAAQPAARLKKLLPLGIVAFQQLLAPGIAEVEPLVLALDALLKEQAEHLRPDYLLAQGQQVFYHHPALNGDTFAPSTINIVREPALKKSHPCYVCKQPHSFAHFFYRYLCPRCGDLNYQKRAIPALLSGRVALVTGARVKIGYACALRLLRAGAQVIATTRFPHDAAHRFSREPDFAAWQDRLHIYGLDFRYLPVLERFVQHLHATYPALDILINNAAQTVRRTLDYYAPLLPYERASLAELPPAQQELVRRSHETLPPTPFVASGEGQLSLTTNLSSSQIAFENAPGPGEPLLQLQTAQGGLVLRSQAAGDIVPGPGRQNSWALPFNEIDLTEFLEVQTINATTPFLLVSQLHP
ncbi:MAG TPA: SDR family NAD(P)-dependent oxidoreductase, partial [Ktedonobacteraceae bacterium]